MCRPEPRLTSPGYASVPNGGYSRNAADDTPYSSTYQSQPGALSGGQQMPLSQSHHNSRAAGGSALRQPHYEAAMAPRHGVTPQYEAHSSFARHGPVLQHARHGVVLGDSAGQARTPRAAGKDGLGRGVCGILTAAVARASCGGCAYWQAHLEDNGCNCGWQY